MPVPVAAAHLGGPLPAKTVALGAAGLLDYLAQRILDEPNALLAQVQRASAVAVGRVDRVYSVAHTPSAALLAAAEAEHLPVEHEPAGPRLYLQAAEGTLREGLWGGARPGPLRVVWLPPADRPGAGPGLAAGAAGVLFLVEPAGSALADELAASDGAAWAPVAPRALVADADGAVERAVRWWVATVDLARPARLEAIGRALGRAHGVELAVALQAAAIEGRGAGAAVATALAGSQGARALALRAVLWRVGERKAACRGLDPRTLDESALAAWHVAPVTDAGGGRTGFVAPDAGAATDWAAVDRPPAGGGGHAP